MTTGWVVTCRVIGGIGLLLLIGLALVWGEYSSGPKAASEKPETAYEPPKAALEKTEPAMGTKQKEPAADHPATTPQAVPPTGPEQSLAESEPAKSPPPIPPPTASGPLELLKRVYARESTDASAREAERLIRSLFGAEHLPAELLRSVTCRATVCKIDMVWSKQYPLSHMALAMKIAPQQTSLLALEPAPEPDRSGDLRLEIYVVRAGYTLADLE